MAVSPIDPKEVLLPQLYGSKNYKEGERGNITCICSNPEAILTLKRGDKELASGVSPLSFAGEVPFWFNDLEIICYASLGHSEGQSKVMLINVEYGPRLHSICGSKCTVKIENGKIRVPLMANPNPTICDWTVNGEAANRSLVLGSPKVTEQSYKYGQTIYWATMQYVSNDSMTMDYLLGKDLSFLASNTEGYSELTASIAAAANLSKSGWALIAVLGIAAFGGVAGYIYSRFFARGARNRRATQQLHSSRNTSVNDMPQLGERNTIL